MGNSPTSLLKAAITKNNVEDLKILLRNPEVRSSLGQPLNRKQDASLALAVRLTFYDMIPVLLEAGAEINILNRDNETPIDILLKLILPEDDDILHHHCCLYPHPERDSFVIPDALRILLNSGGTGQSLQRLVLHTMKDSSVVLELCRLVAGLEDPTNYRLSGLLLQVAVWFDLYDCLQSLLVRGVDVLNFWRSTFVPTLVPNNNYRPPVWQRGDSGEYVLPSSSSSPDSYAIQTLKLSFVQDWRAEWNDGGNPSAQYRAGLHLTPDSATLFARSANTYLALVHIMRDVLHFLPCSCSGPRLNDTNLVTTLALAGYRFSHEEMMHLQLKFDVDFKRYLRYQSNPKPLRHLSRTVVRFNMNYNVFSSLDKISYIPNSLKEFILIRDGEEIL